jgi:hypothetical protein
MKPSLDRALKMIWLGIGAVVLLFLLAGLVMVVSQATRNAGAAEDAARVASADAADSRQPAMVRFGMPDSILGTRTRIVRVHDGTVPNRRISAESGDYSRSDDEVNVMFVDAQGVRLLLDRPAHIRELSYPRTDDAPRTWISYVMALDDTDGNRRVDEADARALYVTDLDGRNLRPVLGPPLRYQSHAAFDATRILVYALEGSGRDEARMRQRAFLYDLRAGRLAPYDAMDAAAARAGQILRR